MSNAGRAVLSTMLDRLLAGLMSGPNMNCRPHASRQRVDLTALSKLADVTPEAVLRGLLGPDESARVVARVRLPRKADRPEGEPESDGQRRYREQQALLGKLRVIADEATTYEHDTGVWALAVGFPLVSVPPPDGEGKRVLAPVAFVPVSVTVTGGAKPAVDLACRPEAGGRVRPNAALFAWVEQQTGRAPPAEGDDHADPWAEVAALVAHVAGALKLTAPPMPVASAAPAATEGVALPAVEFPLVPAGTPIGAGPAEESGDEPRVEWAAVLGLFPVANQGLLRDTRAMMGETPGGPVRAFLSAGPEVTPEPPPVAVAPEPAWLAADADPCQARAVAAARDAEVLVVHGPPGTGKSQTITNVIADHLYRGQRVLLVCDKRAALDVVADRLARLGLGDLSAIVHDPRRDQGHLYAALKRQLDQLKDAQTKPQAQGQLARADADLAAVHRELTAYHASVMGPTADGPSFSDLVGRWLVSTDDAALRLDPAVAAGVTVATVDAHRAALADLFERALAVDLPRNPWAKCGGGSLAAYLARPMAAVRQAMARCVAAAESADATNGAGVPPFDPAVPLVEQAHLRAGWGEAVGRLLPDVRAAGLAGWAGRDPAAVRAAAASVEAVLELARDGDEHPLDPALRATTVPPAEVGPDLSALAAFLAVAGSWSAAFAFSAKAEAKRVLARFGLPLDRPSAERASAFLAGLQRRAALSAVWADLTGVAGPGTDQQRQDLPLAADWLGQMRRLADVPALAGLSAAVGRAAADPAAADALLAGLAASPARAEALVRLDEQLLAAGLFGPAWLGESAAQQRRGEPAAEPVRTLAERVDTLEGVLRARDARAAVPGELGLAVDRLIAQGAGSDAALAVLDRAGVERAIADRLRADPGLQGTDARRIDGLFEQYRQLAERRRTGVRDAVRHTWVGRQQARFLERAGTKLAGAGADLKRRLTSRGKNASRLRQVFADGGDALLDLCPVWMASPETVAQVFPRQALFDVVIFDEASQCRLEEAVPVLVRGRRAMIAGDPQQLPPTRFFESGSVLGGGEDDDEDGDEQSLFEAHQAATGDLLSAALNLSVRQSYLDVHYRSRSADLIAFSNRHFYDGRLVPIPSRRAGGAGVVLHAVAGEYARRRNPVEAEAVVAVVRELLGRAEPPSVGVACLNLPQRDLIVEKLDEAAEADADFAERLAAARARSGSGASDGLFVKNLENVQGDERDVIVISTTYGPGPDGKFHRRFGPLGMPGGGRRLNVLVTRARDAVHVVTSIPADAYRSLPAVPDGQVAGGAWLLLAYLRAAAAGERDAAAVGPTRYPSLLVEAVAGRAGPADLYWGNDGFCIDVAGRASAVGVLVDGCRYAAAGDAVEWDVFRTGVLAEQGWRLTRVWSPHLFRDPDGVLKSVRALAADGA